MINPLISHGIFWTVTFIVFIGLVIIFKSVLFPFILGATLAYLLNPTVTWLTNKGMGRKSAVFLILGSFMVVFSALLALIVPILIREAAGFIDEAPLYADRVWAMAQPWIDAVREKFGYKLTAQIQDVVQENIGKTFGVGKSIAANLASGIAIGGQAIIGFAALLLIVPIVAFFMMNDWPRITAWVDGLMPLHSRATIHDLLNQIDVKIAGFIRGQVTVCFILGMMYAIALTFAGLNYGFVIGLGTGILCIIPFAGTAIGFATGIIVALLQSGGDITYVALIGGIFAMGQFIEGNFITPRLIGNSVGLHPLWIMFALLAGGSLLGLTGMFLAVPVAAIISVILSFLIQRYKGSPYYNTGPAPLPSPTAQVHVQYENSNPS